MIPNNSIPTYPLSSTKHTLYLKRCEYHKSIGIFFLILLFCFSLNFFPKWAHSSKLSFGLSDNKRSTTRILCFKCKNKHVLDCKHQSKILLHQHHLAPLVQRVDSAIQWINCYPLDNAINFDSTYPLDSDLSNGKRYPPFEQLGPACKFFGYYKT